MAEELIELGQQVSALPAVTSPIRAVTISPKEGELLVRIVDAVVAFARSYPVEFHSYCPRERWDPVLQKAGTGIAQIERQISEGRQAITVDAGTVMAIMDLEECVSAARDRRLSSAKLALMISAAGAIAEGFLGLTWAGIPAYLASLAIILGRPIAERAKEVPDEPFRVDTLSGRRSMGEEDQDIPKLVERVIVCPVQKEQRYNWGSVRPNPRGPEGALCIEKGVFRVRIEGWVEDIITLNEGWKITQLSNCIVAKHEITVWQPCAAPPRKTLFGPINMDSGEKESYWVEYTGPFTGGVCRKAGPFCCMMDSGQHAIEDAGIQPGQEGGYIIFNHNGDLVKDASDLGGI